MSAAPQIEINLDPDLTANVQAGRLSPMEGSIYQIHRDLRTLIAAGKTQPPSPPVVVAAPPADATKPPA
jgi:hypothetical protein